MPFDVQFYRAYYGDIATMSLADAVRHYEQFGRAEGRFADMPGYLDHARTACGLPADFDPYLYLHLNADLTHLGSAIEAVRHYVTYGRFEGRPYIDVESLEDAAKRTKLDLDFYRAYYTDLSDYSPQQALQHFETQGAREGRYANQEAFLAQVAQESRRLPDDFDPEGYLALNPDLRASLTRPWDPAYHYLRYGREEGRKYRRTAVVYDKSRLNAALASVYDMPEVVLDPTRSPTINVLVPAFDFASISAGFFGVFQTALYADSLGYNVRLVMYDRFHFDEAEMRRNLRNYPGLERLLDRVETVYVGDRDRPLRVSPQDNCIATVWYSAYLARKVSSVVDNKTFLYLIQDYETVFYASGSLFALAEATYDFDYAALFSTKALQSYFVEKAIGRFRGEAPRHTFFNNACNRSLPSRASFMAAKARSGVKRLAFYSRPIVDRNMFELGALALCEAVERGLFKGGSWEFYGIGLGDAVIKLGPDATMTQLPRMNLREYQDMISSFDVGLCLMASSHPSLLPFDLAGSGAVVVTNFFGVKCQDYFDALAPGVIAAAPDVESLVAALRRAVRQADDLDARYSAAADMTFPTSWDETWTGHHDAFAREAFAGTPQRRRRREATVEPGGTLRLVSARAA